MPDSLTTRRDRDEAAEPVNPESWFLVTPTYRGDVEQFALLSESFQRFAPQGLHHWVIVDRRDLSLFQPLRHPRMKLTTKEDLFPCRVRRATLGSRTIWISTRFPPVRGWVIQQLVKIQAAATSQRPFVLFADSDVVFLRPFDMTRFTDGERLALSRVAYDFDDLATWRRSSAALLGLPHPERFARVNYVSGLIPWRRDVARALVEHIAARHHGSWLFPTARQLRLSEYTVYGVYAEEVLGLRAAGHYAWDDPILNLRWDDDMTTREDLARLLNETSDEHIGAMFHSKRNFNRADLRSLVEDWWARYSSAAGPTTRAD